MEGHCKFLGGGRVLKVKILEAKYELPAKLEFPGGTGVGKQKPFHGGGWIFSGTTHSMYHPTVSIDGHTLEFHLHTQNLELAYDSY